MDELLPGHLGPCVRLELEVVSPPAGQAHPLDQPDLNEYPGHGAHGAPGWPGGIQPTDSGIDVVGPRSTACLIPFRSDSDVKTQLARLCTPARSGLRHKICATVKPNPYNIPLFKSAGCV